MVLVCRVPRRRFKGTRALTVFVGFQYLVRISRLMRALSSNTKGFSAAFFFLATSSRQICLIFRGVADGLDSGQGAVELGEHRVDGAGGQNRLAGVVVARVAAENVLVVHAAQLEVLAYARRCSPPGGSPGAGFFLRAPDLALAQLFLEMNKDGVLVARDHDVDVIRGNDA